jgi:peptidoglycan-N-acetylglucosamine deacetylase
MSGMDAFCCGPAPFSCVAARNRARIAAAHAAADIVGPMAAGGERYARRSRVTGCASRAIAAGALCVAAALALSGCAGPLSPDAGSWLTPQPIPGNSTATTPTPDAAPSPDPMPGPRVEYGMPVPTVPPPDGLVPRLAAMAAEGFAASARWAELPGSAALNGALGERIAGAVHEFVGRHGSGWSPGLDIAPGGVGSSCAPDGSGVGLVGPTLRIGCELVTAAGPFLAERLVRIERDDRLATSIRREVLYADTATDTVMTGAGLYVDTGIRRVLNLLAEGLRSSGRVAAGVDPFAGVDDAGARTILADSVVMSNGDVVVTVPLEPATDGTGLRAMPVVVPGRLLVPFLSPLGAAVRDAVVAAAPFTMPPPADLGQPVDCTLLPCVALTFDDGPSGEATERLLDVLATRRAPATFYLQGGYVANDPGLVARIAAAGHELGNHTWGHPYLTNLPDDQVRKEVERTAAEIHAASGIWPASVRPPYGDFDGRVAGLVGAPLVIWDVDTKDWAQPGVDVVIDRAVNWSGRGSIVLMHDTHGSTVDAVPGILDGLAVRGFAFATVSGLFGGSLPGAGTVVRHGPG